MSPQFRIFAACTIAGGISFALIYLIMGLTGALDKARAAEVALAPLAIGILAGAIFAILYRFLWPDRHQVGRWADLSGCSLAREPKNPGDRRERNNRLIRNPAKRRQGL